jgi:hypothetical protein
MPIWPELRPLYPPHWRELSSHVRFERAGGKCQRCGRPQLAHLRCLLVRRRGGTAEDALPDGPILWKRLGFGSRASCSQRRTWIATRPTIG